MCNTSAKSVIQFKLLIAILDYDWLMIKKGSGQDQWNLLFWNQACALDGAIFPWLRDTRAFLLLNHLDIFSCMLLISNHVIFFRTIWNKFSKTSDCTSPYFVSLKNLPVLIYSKLHSKSCDYLYIKPARLLNSTKILCVIYIYTTPITVTIQTNQMPRH